MAAELERDEEECPAFGITSSEEDDIESEEDEMLLLAYLRSTRHRKRRWSVRPLNKKRELEGEYKMVRQMRELDEEKHFSYFRMSAARFDDLKRRIEPFVKHANTHCSPIDLGERLAVALRFLASGNSQQCLAASYKMGNATVCAIITEVCTAIWEALHADFVKLPATHQEWCDQAKDFWTFWNFPNCVGSIGGRHVTIKGPSAAGNDYFRYKRSRSIVLQGVCDARYRFTVLDVGAYGLESDAVFQLSTFGSKLLEGNLGLPDPSKLPGSRLWAPYVVVGDAAFPIHVNLMRPFEGSNLTDEEHVYNCRHNQARRIIEDSFGILAARWRILGRAIECKPEKVETIVRACVALHNFLISAEMTEKDPRYLPPDFVDHVNCISGDIEPGEWRRHVEGDVNLMGIYHLSAERATDAAVCVRNDFKTFFCTPSGQVPWQEACIRKDLGGS